MAPKVSSKWFGKQIKGCRNKRSQDCKALDHVTRAVGISCFQYLECLDTLKLLDLYRLGTAVMSLFLSMSTDVCTVCRLSGVSFVNSNVCKILYVITCLCHWVRVEITNKAYSTVDGKGQGNDKYKEFIIINAG